MRKSCSCKSPTSNNRRFNQFNSNQSMMMNSSRSLFKNLDWEKQSLEDVNMRFYEVSSFESFGAYIDMKQKVRKERG